MNEVTREIPLQTRELSAAILDKESRRVRMVASTGARRITWSWEEWGLVEEELVVEEGAVDLSRLLSSAPILDTHNRRTMDDQVGVTETAKVQGRELVVESRIFKGDDRADKIWNKIEQGARNLSVGYFVHQYEVTKTPGKLPLYRAVKWEPYEISCCPAGADPGAQIREQALTTTCRFITRAVESASPTEKEMKPEKTPGKAPATETRSEEKPSLATAQGVAAAIEKGTKEALAAWHGNRAEDATPAKAPASSDEEHLRTIAEALGHEGELSLPALARAATTFRELYDATEARAQRAEEEKEEDLFAINEKKGLHRKLEGVRKGFARELYESNRSLYLREVEKVKPLVGQKAPSANPAGRRTVAQHQEAADDMEREVLLLEKRLLEADPKLDPSEAYRQAFRTVQERHRHAQAQAG